MPVSKEQSTSGRIQESGPAPQALPSSKLPSSPGDSPRQVTPKDITPEHASWKDMRSRDITMSHGTSSKRAAAGVDDTDCAARQEQAAAPLTPPSAVLPSSPGESPLEVTPKDITPEHAAWSDIHTREIASGGAVRREESMIDESIELSFPASDPPAELPASGVSVKTEKCGDEEENLLDEAIELTFPASDPIAVSRPDRIDVRRAAP